MTICQNYSNRSATLHSMAAKAENQKEKHSKASIFSLTIAKSLIYFTEMFLIWPSTKSAQTVLFSGTIWLPKLKIAKPLNEFSLITAQILFHRNVSYVNLYQNCSNDSAPLHSMTVRAKHQNKPLNDFFSSITSWILNRFTEIFLM